MPRPLTYADDRDRLARAGAASLTRIEGDLTEEKQFNYQVARQAEQDARADAAAARSEKREERLTETEERQSKIQQYHFEKEKKIDANADKYLEEKEINAGKASDELQAIRTDAPDARLKLAEWRHNNFRLLHEDPKIGDKRLIAQADLNEKLITKREETAAKLAEEKARTERLKAVGATVSGGTVDGLNYTVPKSSDDSEAKALEKERSLYARELSKARDRRIRAERESNKGLQVDADNDSKEYQQKLEEVESQIRTHRAGSAPAPGQPAASPTAPAIAQFDTEDAARAAGHKTGEIVVLINPKTGKPARARLD